MAAFDKLSPDELVIIFSILRDWDYSEFAECSRSEVDGRNWDWVIVMYVCRRWHTTTLNCPSLWTHLPVYVFRSRQRTKAYLERSNGAELMVSANIDRQPKDTVEESRAFVDTLKCLHRIRHLYLRFHVDYRRRNRELWGQIQDNLSREAPRLRSLDLSISTPMHQADAFYTSFPEKSPHLQSLNLAYMVIHPQSALLTVTNLVE